MLLEAYFTFFQMTIMKGEMFTIAVISFMLSLPVFAAVVLSTKLMRRGKELKIAPKIIYQLILTEVWLCLAMLFEAIWYGSFELSYFLPALEFGAIVYFTLVLPLSLVYWKMMEGYQKLPWHFIQYIFSLAGTTIFTALAILVFNIFQFAT